MPAEQPPRVLILAKDKPGLREAVDFLRARGAEVELLVGKLGDPFPERISSWSGDILVSYVCPWIVPPAALAAPRVAALNFHPGPPEYPGIGCTNFALYDEAREFGVTCHHMAANVDTGAIVEVLRFPILPEDDVKSLTDKCYAAIQRAFLSVFGAYLDTGRMPESKERWTRKPYRRAELDELCRLTLAMDRAEVGRRVRATYYPGMPGPYVDFHGRRFKYSPDV